MKLKEISVLNRPPTENESYIGGGCNLISADFWPRDKNNKPCMHLLTMECKFFDDELCNRYISVFIPYDDRKYYTQIRGELVDNYTAIIIHDRTGPYINCFLDASIETIQKALVVQQQNLDDSAEICGSKIFGYPAWLQAPEQIENHHCVLSLYGNDISLAFNENRGLFLDGVVYLFIKDDYSTYENYSNIGKLIWQL